jgi:hypothetical protein
MLLQNKDMAKVGLFPCLGKNLKKKKILAIIG